MRPEMVCLSAVGEDRSRGIGCASAGEKALETYIAGERDRCHDTWGIHSKIRMLKQCGKAQSSPNRAQAEFQSVMVLEGRILGKER